MPKVTIKHSEIPDIINSTLEKAPEASAFQNKDILLQVEWHHLAAPSTSLGPAFHALLGLFPDNACQSNLRSHTLSFFPLPPNLRTHPLTHSQS